MPNHLHVILVITDHVTYIKRRGTACRAPTPTDERFGKPTSGSLPTVVRSFKSAATKQINYIRKARGTRVWQRNYYERVIRDEDELHRLRQYVIDNPAQWETDEDNPYRQVEVRTLQ